MSTVTWNKTHVAADKQASDSGMRLLTTKVWRHGDEVLAYVGKSDSALMVARWYLAGADPDKWPDCQKDKDEAAYLLVARKGSAVVYEHQPAPIPLEGEFYAMGSGRDYAMAAMHLGKSAREAIEVAAVFDTGTGMGVDVFEL